MSFCIQWPTEFNKITQQFAARPEFYTKFGLPGHEGLDFQAPLGSPVYAVADGVVSEVRLDDNSDLMKKPYGNQLRIEHADGYTTIYAHLSHVSVSSGQAVRSGDLVGLSGSSGNSDAPHLHLTLKRQGATQAGQTTFPRDIVDPTPYLQPFAKPTPPPPPDPPTMQVQVDSGEAGFLNVRSAPGTDSEIIAQVNHGTLLGTLEPADVARHKVGQYEQWLWVRTPDDVVGYVAAWYVRLPQEMQQPITVVVESPDENLRVRSGPGIGYSELTRVPHGTVLLALEAEGVVQQKVGHYGEWLNVRTPGGVTGYTAAWYVRLPTVALPKAVMTPQLLKSPPLAEAEEERRLVRADRLQRIRGIGPKIERLLYTLGIATFEQVAALNEQQLRAILGEARTRGMDVASWPEQARRILAGQEPPVHRRPAHRR